MVDIWCIPVNVEFTGPKTVRSAKATKKITSMQWAGVLAITGGLHISPTDTLNTSTFLLPAQLMIKKWCIRAQVRMATLPTDHPLFKVVNWKRACATKRHRSPLNTLANLTITDTRRIEKIPTIGRNPSSTGELPFHIRIPVDKKALAQEAKNASEEIQVFTDGSAQGGKVGAATILIRNNRPICILHYHLGPESEHTIHEAELAGILLAAYLIRTEKQGPTSCSIAVDNQATLRAFNSELRKPGHHLTWEVLLLATRIQKHRSKNKYSLMLRWTAGHISIAGNEKADNEAKKAVAGLSSDKELLPAYLRKPLLINPSAVKQKLIDKLKKDWSKEWLKSKRGKIMSKIDNTTPSNKFIKTISNAKLSHKASSRIVQLRLWHVPLNSYLFKFQRMDKANCPACSTNNEDIVHFLLHCTHYAFERWALAKHVKKKQKSMTIETLLGDPELAIPLANYINGTSCFKEKPGEQTLSHNNTTTRETQHRQT